MCQISAIGDDKGVRLVVFLIALMPTLSASAYDYPLSPTAVREAYFLGRRADEKTIEFLGKYLKQMPLPDEGPYVSEISLLTPYAQVVLVSWRNAVGYSAQQAETDYHSQGDKILVKLTIKFTATYGAMQGTKPDKNAVGKEGLVLRAQDFWRDFRFELSQNARRIMARDVHGVPIYDHSGFRGVEVSLVYDSKEVASEETSVEVVTPDKHHVVARFDLSELR